MHNVQFNFAVQRIYDVVTGTHQFTHHSYTSSRAQFTSVFVPPTHFTYIMQIQVCELSITQVHVNLIHGYPYHIKNQNAKKLWKKCNTKTGHGKMSLNLKMRGRQRKRKRMNMKINQKKVMIKILKKNKEYFRLTEV